MFVPVKTCVSATMMTCPLTLDHAVGATDQKRVSRDD
jgi:hypothetical protein